MQVAFLASGNTTNATTFDLDDVSLLATMPAPPTSTPVPPSATPTNTPGGVEPPTDTPTPTATSGGTTPDELVSNGGFESGLTNWTVHGSPSAITSQHHTGSASAQLCGRVSCSDQLIQTVSLPATMTSGSISYWYRITTAETSASCLDRLTVSIRTTAGGTISLIQTLCNTNKTNSWVEKTLVLPSTVLSRKGQSVQVAFLASGNTTNATTFDLDDVSLTVAGGGITVKATATATPQSDSDWSCSTGDTAAACGSKTLAPLPSARNQAGVSVGSDGTIDVVGGYSPSAAGNRFERYDPASNRWICSVGDTGRGCASKTLMPLPSARSGVGMATDGDGTIWVIGGAPTTMADRVEAYDPTTNKWSCSVGDTGSGCTSKSIPALPTPRNNPRVLAASDGTIWVIGGFTASGAGSSVVEAYNPASNTWSAA